MLLGKQYVEYCQVIKIKNITRLQNIDIVAIVARLHNYFQVSRITNITMLLKQMILQGY